MKRENVIAVSEFLATAAVIGAGFAISGPIAASVVTAIGTNLSSSVIDSHYRGLKESWLSDGGVLNQDIQRALTRAYIKALTQIEDKYFKLAYSQTLADRKKKSIKNLFIYLKERARENFAPSIQKAALTKNVQDYLYLEQDQALTNLWETVDAAKVIYSNGKHFGEFFKENLLSEVQYWFSEELKTDSKECNKAWRAFQRMLLEGIQADVQNVKESQMSRRDLIKLESLQQRLDEIKDVIDHRLPDEPFEKSLDSAVIQIHGTLRDVAEMSARTEQKIDIIAADVKTLSSQLLPEGVRNHAEVWIWTNYSDEISQAALKKINKQVALKKIDKQAEVKVIEAAKTAWENVDWKLAAAKYNWELISNYGTTRILGKSEPIPLEGIFTDVYILDRPTAFRRFDISNLKQDPDKYENEGARAPGLELVRRKDGFRLFILGKPGAGKTTFLRHITLQAARGNLNRIPIFISLKKLSDSNLDLMPFIYKEFAICGFPEAEPFVKTILEKGEAIVLFDGLDEVSQEDKQRDKTIAAIRDFSYQYNKCQCLITCRIAATDYTFEQFKYVELADFTKNQINSYVDKWFQDNSEKRSRFHREFDKEENRGLRELARVPLLLGLLCLSFDATMTFPQRRVEIYAEALEALLKRWDSSKSIKRDDIYRGLTLGRKSQMFARIAFQTFLNKDYFLPQQNLVKQVVNYLKQLPNAPDEIDIDGDVVLKAIEEQHGIFSERASRIYSFSHLTFQEYFTAKHIVEDASGSSLRGLLVADNILDSRWREVILLTVSLLDDATFFFKLFKEALETLIRSETAICNLLDLANLKAQGETANYGQSALRAYHCFRTLAFDLAVVINRDLYGQQKYDAAHALADATNHDLALVNTRVEDLIESLNPARNRERSLSDTLHRPGSSEGNEGIVEMKLDHARLHVKELERAREQALARDRARELSLSLSRGFGNGNENNLTSELKLDIQLSNLLLVSDLLTGNTTPLTLSRYNKYFSDIRTEVEKSGPTRFSSELALVQSLTEKWNNEVRDGFTKKLREVLGTYRNIGQECLLSQEQCQKMTKYFVASQLLLECLKLAVVPNRQPLENSLLLSPQ